MKILHFDYDHLDNPFAGGGQANATKHLYENTDDDITVIFGNYPGATRHTRYGIDYVPLGIGGAGKTVSILSYWFLIPIYCLFHQSKYEIIVEFFTAPFSTSLLPLIRKIPLVAFPTSFDAEKIAMKYKIPFHIIQNNLVRYYPAIICLTSVLQEKIQRLSPRTRTYILPRGISNELLNLQKIHTNNVIYIGRIDYHNKGIDLLLYNWAKFIKASNVSYKLIIAGNGNAQSIEKLNHGISELNIGSSVQFIGRVTGKDKLRLFSEAKALVLPSRFETFGNVALEAIATKTILLVSDIPDLSWIPSDCCIRFSIAEEMKLDLSNKLQLIDNSDVHNLIASGHKLASTMSWDHIRNNFHAILVEEVKNQKKDKKL